MTASITFTVDDDAVIRALTNAEHAFENAVDLVAQAVADDVRIEAGHSSRRLGAPWRIEGTGPTERHVIAPEWWAHFLAGGTQDHGPSDAPLLVFETDGDIVFTSFVRGIPATHFDEAAVNRARGQLDSIFHRIIEEAT